MGNPREAKPVLPGFGNLGAHQEPLASANQAKRKRDESATNQLKKKIILIISLSC